MPSAAHPDRVVGNPGREAPPERGCDVQLVPLTLPLPSSGAVRYGAWTRQGPSACFAFNIHCQPLGQTQRLHKMQRNRFEPGGGGGCGADRGITCVSLVTRTHACTELNGLVPAHPLRLDCPAGKSPTLVPSEGRFQASPDAILTQYSPNPKSRNKIARLAHLTPHSFGGRGRNLFHLLGVGCPGLPHENTPGRQ